MSFGEQDRRFEGFARQIRVFGGDVVQAVAVLEASLDGMNGDARAFDKRQPTLDAGNALDPGLSSA